MGEVELPEIGFGECCYNCMYMAEVITNTSFCWKHELDVHYENTCKEFQFPRFSTE